MQMFSFCMGRCFGKLRNIARVASVFSTENENYRKREYNYRKHHIKFPYVYSMIGSVSLTAANVNDKEGGNSPPSLTRQSSSPSPSNHVKRSANGRFTKHGAKGTPKSLEHMRRGYQNYIAKRKLEFGNCIDENKPPSKRETRSTPLSHQGKGRGEALGTRLYSTYRREGLIAILSKPPTSSSSASPRVSNTPRISATIVKYFEEKIL